MEKYGGFVHNLSYTGGEKLIVIDPTPRESMVSTKGFVLLK